MPAFFHNLRFMLALPVLTLLAGCVPVRAHVPTTAAAAPPSVVTTTTKIEVVNASTGVSVNDTLDVLVSGEDDLSGSYKVSDTGDITLPLLPAPLHVVGQTIPAVTQAITDAYKDGYLIDPKVSVTLYVKAGNQ